MNKLEIILGEEYKVKVEKLEKFNESLFRDLYIQAFKKTKEILGANAKEDKSEHYNNIIAFVGERGTGKTSSMLSVSGALKVKFKMGDKYFEEFDMKVGNGNKLSSYNFHSVGVIDPAMLSHNNNILEIVIAKMFQGFKKHLDNNSYTEVNEDKKRDLIKNFQEVFNNLKTTKNGKELAKEDSLDALLAISASTDFKQNIGKLVDSYLDFIVGEDKKYKSNVLLLEIDDIDLNTKHAYAMIEQIRKYLIIPNVVILMAVKIEQLSEIIEREMAEEFKIMLDKGQMSFDSIKNMAEKYLEKFIPFERRLSLPYLFDISKDCMMIIKDKNKSDDEKNDEKYQSIDSELRELIYRKTDILFLDGKYIVPSNLRGLIELVVLLTGFDNIKEKGVKERAEVVQSEGYRSFKKYFFSTWTQANLPKKYSSILVELYNKPIESKNKYTVNKIEDLYSFISKDEKYLQRAEVKNYGELEKEYQEIVHLNNTDYNVSLGDVLFVLNKANKYKIDDEDKRFFYGVKTVYSFMLYETFALSDKENYKTLLGGYIYNPSIYPLLSREAGGRDRSRRDISLIPFYEFEHKFTKCCMEDENFKWETYFTTYSLFDLFESFIIKDGNFDGVKKYRQENRKFYSKKPFNTLKGQKRIEFDVLGFFFNEPNPNYLIDNIEVLEILLEKKYQSSGASYIDNLNDFFEYIKKFSIKSIFPNYSLDFGIINCLEDFSSLISLTRKFDLVQDFEDVFKKTMSDMEIIKMKQAIFLALKFSSMGDISLENLQKEIRSKLKSKIFQNPKETVIKRIYERIEVVVESLDKIDRFKIEKNGKIKYSRKEMEKFYVDLIEEYLNGYYGE